MNSGKNEDSTVPKGWILCSSKSNPGRKYYFNRKTGKSSWTKPQVNFVKNNFYLLISFFPFLIKFMNANKHCFKTCSKLK